MNFLKKIIKNTKTDNKVTLNDFICSFKFNLESSLLFATHSSRLKTPSREILRFEYRKSHSHPRPRVPGQFEKQ